MENFPQKNEGRRWRGGRWGNFSGNEINKIQRNNIPKIFPWKRVPHKELLKDINMILSKEKLREDSYIPTNDGCL